MWPTPSLQERGCALASVQRALSDDMDQAAGAAYKGSKAERNPEVETPASARAVACSMDDYSPEKVGMQTESRNSLFV